MKVKILICVLATFLIGGCAKDSHFFVSPIARTLTCLTSPCDVPVSVTRHWWHFWEDQIESPYEVHTSAATPSIRWNLDLVADKYSFTSNGIVFIDPDHGTASPFIKCKRDETGINFQCEYNGTAMKGDKFKYTITLMPKLRAPAVDPLDPWIVID